MKPVAALVAQSVDIDLLEKRLHVAIKGLEDAGRTTARLEGQLESARGAAKARRLEIGQILTEARPAFAGKGRPRAGAEPWAAFLARVGLDERTAHNYMAEFRDPVEFGKRLPNYRETPDDPPPDDDDGQTGAKSPGIIPLGDKPPFRQLTADDLIQRRREDAEALARLSPKERKRVLAADKVNLQGGSGEVERGTWCTPKAWAEAVGPFEVDPFSNPHSHVRAVVRCMRENGGDGFGGGDGARPGTYRVGARPANERIGDPGAPASLGHASELTSVWIQPPYEVGFVERVIAHYGHTRFVALLRLSPDPAWFRRLWPLVATIAIPVERIAFEPPPNVPPPDSTISYPHALYYACAADVTDAIRERCIVLDVDHGRCDPASLRQALRLVE